MALSRSGYTVRPRGCGGIGRRARFRSVCPSGRGGSSPLIRIFLPCEHVSPSMSFARRGLCIVVLCLFALATGAARAEQRATASDRVQVVVGVEQAPLATPRWAAGRELQTRTLLSSQRALAARIETALPEAQVRWRYRLVANGLAVVVPRSEVEH